MKKCLLFVVCLMLFLTGCQADGFETMTADQVQEIMNTQEDYVIVDVRTDQEYDQGHIPNAICIPNEEINDEKPDELEDLNQMILVYCRSGNRSRQACKKLVDLGYTNVIDFGGINDWTGDIE